MLNSHYNRALILAKKGWLITGLFFINSATFSNELAPKFTYRKKAEKRSNRRSQLDYSLAFKLYVVHQVGVFCLLVFVCTVKLTGC